MKKIELTIEQLRIINQILFYVEKDYLGTMQNPMVISKGDMKNIGQIRNKIKKAFTV